MKLFFLLSLLFSFCVFGASDSDSYSSVAKCGIYKAEGLLEKRGGKKPYVVLLTDKGTESEVTFYLGKYDEKYKNYISTNVATLIEVKKVCLYHCKAKLTKLVKFLSPFDQPASFVYPIPKPIIDVACAN